MRLTRTLLAIAVLGGVVSADAGETITYSYDALGRLVQVTRTGTVNNNVQATYTVDAAGNRVNVTVTKP